jgi:hypothetical protein
MLIVARGRTGSTDIPSSVFASAVVRLAFSGRLVVPAYRKRKARSGMPSITTATSAAVNLLAARSSCGPETAGPAHRGQSRP